MHASGNSDIEPALQPGTLSDPVVQSRLPFELTRLAFSPPHFEGSLAENIRSSALPVSTSRQLRFDFAPITPKMS